MEYIIYFSGFYTIFLAIFHIGFWKIFKWNTDLKKLSFANNAIMQLLNIQIIFYFLFTAIICFSFPKELLTTELGNYFLAGNSLFWLLRTAQQFIFLRVNNFKVHLLTILFLLGTILFAIPVILK